MPRPTRAYHHGDLRNALVACAAHLVEQGGPERFSLREAARIVGVTANAAYRHFDDKSALLTAVAASGFEDLSRRMQQALGADDSTAGERFKAVGRAYVELALARPELFRLMFGPSGLSCQSGGAAQIQGPTPGALLGRALDDLVTAGQLPPQRRVGAELKVWSAVHGFAMLVLDGRATLHTHAQRWEAFDALLDFIVVGLRGPDAPTPQAPLARRRPG